MEGSESKRKKVVIKKNDLLTKIQKRIKKKIKKKAEGLNEIRQCRKNGVLEHGRLRKKGAPGHEGMFLKGLRTQYISRETLNEANEARKNEDINKIIDIGRVFQKEGLQRRVRKGEFCLHSAPENRNILEKNSAMTPEDFNRCSLTAISPAGATGRPVTYTDATVILHENTFIQFKDRDATVKKQKLNFDKELVMFSLLYEEKIGSQLLPKVIGNDVLEEAFRELRYRPKKGKFKKDKEVEFLKEFKFLKQNSEPEIPLAEIFQEDFHHRNHAHVIAPQSSDICVGITKNPIEHDSINLSIMGICENDLMLTPSFGKEQYKNCEFRTSEFEKQTLNITTPDIQFYRRNMF